MQREYLKFQRLNVCKDWLEKDLLNYIGGSWTPGLHETSYTVIDPSNRDSLVEFKAASPEQVDQAVFSAEVAFRAWRGRSPRSKAALLRGIAALIREHHAELATLESLCNGKLFSESYVDDIPECASIFDYYAGWADKIYGETCPVDQKYINYTRKEPIGVCGLIVPWNFPLYQASLKLAPALVAGNSTIIKPSEYTPLSLTRLIQLISEKLDLPAGLINLVQGGAEVGECLSSHSGIRKISFTGSSRVGRSIVAASAASNLKRVTLELGGKSPNIFFSDTPKLNEALVQSFGAMFSHKGEKCSEPTRFLVHSSIYDQTIETLRELAESVVCGPQFEEASQQGPQCNELQYKKIIKYIDLGLKDEALELVCGGSVADEQGFYIRPTIFSRVCKESKLFQDEIFGPVLCVSVFDDEEEAIQLANSSKYGLAAGLWTKDISRAHRVASQLEAGMIFVNKYGCYDLSSPFGGSKESGWGKELAAHSIDSYTQTKSIWINLDE